MSQLPVGAAVQYFMQLMGQEVPSEPTLPDDETWALRKELIDEEYKEMRDAWEEGDIPGFLDACVDLVYVVAGAAISGGLPFDEAFDAVHRANMTKAPECDDCGGTGHAKQRGMKWYAGPKCEGCAGRGRKVKRRVDGKILKPVGWQAPNIASIIWKETDARPHVTAAE